MPASHRQPSLVGREPELAALDQIVRTIRQGGRLAVIEGEAGLGKTRLVEAVLEAARSAAATVLSSKAQELEAQRPFAAIVDCLSDGVTARWRERVDEHLRVWDLRPDVAQERQFRVAETILELLDDLCTRSPVLLAIEDLHWADPATLGVLARVAREVDRLPVALVVSARPQPRRPELDTLLAVLAARGALELRLGPLDEHACAALLEDVVGARPGARLLGQARRAAGNPLFVCELAAALVADGAIVRHEGGADIAVDEAAPSLPLTILHRLSFLPPDAVGLLGLASVLGVSFSAADLALLAHRPVAELVPPLRSAQRAGVLGEEGDRLAFRHELIRDALYEDMPLSVRQGLHRELAVALAGAGEPPDRVAAHMLRGARPGDERAVASLVDAARDVVGRSAGAAVDLYRHAIALAGDPDATRADLLPELAEALVSAGLLGDGEEACREALQRGVAADAAGRLRLHLMLLLTRRARVTEAIREGEAGLATPEITGRDRVRLQALVAMSRVFDGAIEPAVREASAVMEASDDDVARALATNTLAMAADASGRFGDAAALMQPSVDWAELAASREAYDSRPHMILGLQLIRLDRFDDASATIQRGRRGAEALGMADALPVFHYQAAYLDFSRGRLDDALAELATRARLAEQTDIGWHLSADSLRALVALHRGDVVAAQQHVAAAEAEAAAGAPPFGTDLMVLARALVLEATGQARPALDVIAGTFDAMAAAGALTFLPVLGSELARLAVAAGDPARAAGVVPALQRIAELNPGARSLEAGALRAHGLLTSDAGALVAAATLLDDAGRSLEAARAAEDAGALLAPGQAREQLEHARVAYERAGATHGLARVEAALRALGVRKGVSGPRRRPATGWDALTDTELKVVRLVAERLTNPEIAERMFISRRTVQTHVSHALAKVGVASRRELAAEAARSAGWRFRVEGVGQEAEQAEPAAEGPARPVVDGDEA